jgi:branched-chain amino acid transport system substrate-binding protein
MRGKLSTIAVFTVILGLLATACAPTPEATQVPPTAPPEPEAEATQVSPTAIPEPEAEATPVPPTAEPAAKTVIKIGVVGPLTGDFSFGGYQQLNGSLLAAQEINEADPTVEIQIIAEDDASNCDQTVNAITKLITQDEVLAILGAHNSPCTLLSVPVTAQHQVPQFTVSVGTDITQQGSQYIFRINASAPRQAEELARIAVEELGYTNVGVLFVNDEYGRSCAEAFRDALGDHGVEPVVWETWARGDRDFSGQLTKVQLAEPEAVYCTGNLADEALLVQQARQMGLDFVMLGDTGMTGDQLYEWAGEAAVGTVCVSPWTPQREDPLSQAFTEAFTSEFDGTTPTQHGAQHYDAVYLIYQFFKEQGLGPDLAANRQALREYAAGLTAETAPKRLMDGMYFDDNGEPLYPMLAVELTEGGQWKVMGE